MILRRDLLKTAAALPAAAFAQGVTGPARDSDAFLGDWHGRWKSEARPAGAPLMAQAIPRGRDRYQINFIEEFDQRCGPDAVVEGRAKSGKLRFSGSGWSGDASGESMRGEGVIFRSSAQFELKKTVRLSPNLGTKAPQGAVVLFDGSDLGKWEGINAIHATGPVVWKVQNGITYAPPIPKGQAGVFRHLGTKEAFRDYRLHVEFRLPLYPEATGQARANSGLLFEDYSYHELQILDSYGLPGYYNDCGAIYKIAAPIINMCAPPLQWQSYDITYHAPRYTDDGKLNEAARITVDQNGKLIHKDLELPYTLNGAKLRQEQPKARKVGRIRLTYHDSPVAYRNIWLVRL